MVSEMQERIAKALYANHFGVPPEKWETAGSATQAEFIEDALIAMKEMGQPTDAMDAAGQRRYMDGVNCIAGVPEVADEAAFQLFRHMMSVEIEAAEED